MHTPIVPELCGIEVTDDLFWYRPKLVTTASAAALSDDAVAIRYLTRSKFERFVRASAVYLRRHDLLRQIDEREGAVADANIVLDRVLIGRNPDVDPSQRELARRAYELIWLRQAFVACFNLDGDENPDMYRSYIGENDGVAVFTTVGKIRSLCAGDGGFGGGKDAVVARVQYIDYDRDEMREEEFDYPAYYKRSQFAIENELRFMVRYRIGDMANAVYNCSAPRL
jgi:hypothetical protein